MSTSRRIPPIWSAHQLWGLGGVLILAAAASSAALLLDAGGHHLIASTVIGFATVIAGLFFYQSWRADLRFRKDFLETQQRYADVYDRAGVSIWREDWSEVGAAMARLREAGVLDIAAWYAARPDNARALHATVLITHVNPRSVELMRAGSEAELTGRLCDVLPGSIHSFGRWLAAIDRGDATYVGESTIARCDGEPFDCLVTAALSPGKPLTEVVVSIVEITSYKRAQAQLSQARDEIARAQRIATVGALTASIAHEVNSPLAAIASNASACRRWLERDAPDIGEALDAADAVLRETERARAIIDRTRTYLQRTARVTERRDLRVLIRSALQIVEQEAQIHRISISQDLADDLDSIACEPVQLQQAFVNLMVNAIHAMRDAEQRQLTVRAGTAGGCRWVAIEDTGPGILAEDARRIFEPFYSTKEGGMGMGLSICRTIIEAHGGTLTLTADRRQGARFRVSLPGESV
ncbi:sensor histidine kinase [Sphingomonas sp. CJ99]